MNRSAETRWNLIQAALSKLRFRTVAKKQNCVFVGADCRELLRQLPAESVDCVVTSPPYGKLKNYGARGQIGYGQKWEEEYLRDIGAVLHELHRVCRDAAALWVVLDTVKSSGRTLLLPWEVIRRAEAEGWAFHDLVIWDKGRSLPWSHVGRFRGVFEYVLLFSKGKLGRFALDRIRDIDHLSSYWVKYPERYNPSGKAPSDLWHFPIPVQGSWSRNGIRHFCPFPLAMVARIITLTSREGEVVLDPFAGTGTVLAVASFLGRRALGIDVNAGFAQTFSQKGYKALLGLTKSEVAGPGHESSKNGLRQLIVRLRILKYPKTMFGELLRPDRLGKTARKHIAALVVTQLTSPQRTRRVNSESLARIVVHVLATESAKLSKLREAISAVTRKPPLSKFGLGVSVKVVGMKTWKSSQFIADLPKDRWYLYTRGAFHSYEQTVPPSKLQATLKAACAGTRHRVPPILAPVGVDVPLMVTG